MTIFVIFCDNSKLRFSKNSYFNHELNCPFQNQTQIRKIKLTPEVVVGEILGHSWISSDSVRVNKQSALFYWQNLLIKNLLSVTVRCNFWLWDSESESNDCNFSSQAPPDAGKKNFFPILVREMRSRLLIVD